MKIVLFGPDKKVGLLSNGRILDIHQAASNNVVGLGVPLSTFAALLPLIEGGDAALDAIAKLEARSAASDQPGLWHDAGDVRLHAPWPGRRVMMTGANHPVHIASLFTNFGQPMTEADVLASARKSGPGGFWAVAEPSGPGDAIEIPSSANGLFDFEVEPGIVLSRNGKGIKAADASRHIWGVTVIADWSIREEFWPMKAPNPWMLEKNFDGSKSIGPCILVGNVDPNALDFTTHVNGVLRQSYNSSEMMFSFAEILEHASRNLTFLTGDVISGGTGSGTGIDQTRPTDLANWPRDLFLKPGDFVITGSPQIGSFENRIVAGA